MSSMKRIGEVLRDVLGELGLERAYREEEVLRAFNELMKDYRDRVKAIEFKKGLLKVGVRGAALRQSLLMRGSELLKKMWEMGFKEVEEIRWTNWKET